MKVIKHKEVVSKEVEVNTFQFTPEETAFLTDFIGNTAPCDALNISCEHIKSVIKKEIYRTVVIKENFLGKFYEALKGE